MGLFLFPGVGWFSVAGQVARKQLEGSLDLSVCARWERSERTDEGREPRLGGLSVNGGATARGLVTVAAS